MQKASYKVGIIRVVCHMELFRNLPKNIKGFELAIIMNEAKVSFASCLRLFSLKDISFNRCNFSRDVPFLIGASS